MRVSCARLTILGTVIVAIAFGQFKAITAQGDELRQRQKEIAEGELRYIALKAKASGKQSVVYDRNSWWDDEEPRTPQNRIANATILVVTATGNTETLFYQPPPTFWTVRSMRVEKDLQEVPLKRIPDSCGMVVDASLAPGHIWVPFAGGQRTVDGVSIRHEAHWPVVPVAGRRYLLLGQRCSAQMLQLTFGWQDIYEVLSDGRLVPNPWPNNEYVRFMNDLGSIDKVEQLMRSLK